MPLWLQCDMFFYGRINLAKALTAGEESASRDRGCIGKGFVYAAGVRRSG
jgi:hypothetical protein